MGIPPQPVKWLHGDPRWSYVSPFASYAPVVVIALFFICIIQICLGAVWISNIGGDLSFALVLQPLVIPCISLFNTVPSAHLHLYTHNNNPKLVMWFSGILAVLYLASAILDLAACSGSGIHSLRSECVADSSSDNPQGPKMSQSLWNANIGLWLISAVGYGLHVAMAAKVWMVMRRRDKEAKAAGRERAVDLEIETMSPEEMERQRQKARDRWQSIRDL